MAIYELREYTAVPGRMPELIARFRNHTLGIFERFGFEVVFIATTEIGHHASTDLLYVCKFDSYADLQDKWARFQADEEWTTAKAASEVDGPLVEVINRRILNSAAFA